MLVLFSTAVQFVVQLHALPDFVYPVLHVILIVPPLHVPVSVRDHDEHPVHADEPTVVLFAGPPVYLPLHVFLYVRVEPLYEHVPFAIEHERVHDSVPLDVLVVFDTAEHNAHEFPALLLVKYRPATHDVYRTVELHVYPAANTLVEKNTNDKRAQTRRNLDILLTSFSLYIHIIEKLAHVAQAKNTHM